MREPAPPQKPADTRPAPRINPKRKKALTYLTVIFLSAGLIYFLYWLVWGRFHEYTDDAYVSGNIVQLMPQVSGTVISIYTDDTHLVQEGQEIVKLNNADTLIALEHAAANLAQTVRQVRQYFENVREGIATVALRQANLDSAKLDVRRRIGLVGAKAISIEEAQHIKTAYQSAQAQFDYALHQLGSAIAIVENSHLYEHPLVEEAKSNFKQAYLNWVRTTIQAPVTGYVAKRNAQVGQEVNLGSALMAIIPLNQIWVDANYKESQLSRIRIGQDVVLTADAYGGITYHGKVAGLSAGTGAAFALLPPQNATGNWIKIVQRLPVRIVLDPNEIAKHPLRIGLSMRVTTHTRHLKGDVLSKVPDQKPIYSTTIYDKQLANADKLINSIITSNAPDIYLRGMPLKPDNLHV
ncbi:MAG: HlyD family secretion protein [Gammaproteobacteria bacterium]